MTPKYPWSLVYTFLLFVILSITNVGIAESDIKVAIKVPN